MRTHGDSPASKTPPAVCVDYQTPWRVGTRADGDLEGHVLDAIGEIVVDPYGSTAIPEWEYMQRIVACVNACAGLSDAELAVLKPGELAVAVLERKGARPQLQSAHDGLELERHPEPRLLPVDPLEAGDIPEREVYIAALVAEAQEAAFRELDWKDGTGLCNVCQIGSLGGREIEHAASCWVGRMLGLVKRLTPPGGFAEAAEEEQDETTRGVSACPMKCVSCGFVTSAAYQHCPYDGMILNTAPELMLRQQFEPLKPEAVIEYEVERHPWASEEGNAPPAKRVVTHEQAAAEKAGQLAPEGQRDLLNPYLRRCERHDVLLRLEEVRDQPGYTFYVCDACEREKQQRLKDLFPRMEALA